MDVKLTSSKSSEQWESFKLNAIKNQPIRKTIPINKLEFVTMDLVCYSGVHLGITKKAVNNLITLTGLSQSGKSKIAGVMGEEFVTKLIKVIQSSLAQNKGMNITLTIDPTSKTIIKVSKETNDSIIKNESFFDLVEDTINKGNLVVDSMNFNPNNGNVSINTRSIASEFQIRNLSKEVFQSGMNFRNSLNGFNADPYLTRLWCINGCTTRAFEDSISLNNLTQRDLEQYMIHMADLQKRDYKPLQFESRVQRAMDTPASFAELEKAKLIITSNSKCEGDHLLPFLSSYDNKHNYKSTLAAYAKKGIEIAELNAAQRKNLRTGMSVWDIVNGLTDFSSHDYGFEASDSALMNMQMVAGDILCKEFDTENIFINQPF